jgi:hypothetical protein
MVPHFIRKDIVRIVSNLKNRLFHLKERKKERKKEPKKEREKDTKRERKQYKKAETK